MELKEDIDSMIDSLESIKSDLERSIAIQKAQDAMNEAVPERLAENLELFRELFPDIHRHYEHFKPSDKYELVCSEDGEPNLLVKESGTLFYHGKSPFSDCRELVSNLMEEPSSLSRMVLAANEEDDPLFQFHFHEKNRLAREIQSLCAQPESERKCHESIPTMFMFGLGLGFQLGYLYEVFTPVNLFIVEPDEDLFYYSLCVFDYTSLLNYIKSEDLGIFFYLQNDTEEFVHNVNRYLLTHSSASLPQMYMGVYKSPLMDEFMELVKRDFSSLVFTSGFFDDMLFGMSQAITNISNGIPLLTRGQLPGYVTSKPLVVVGNGPSLDDDIDLLAKVQDRCIIAACGTAYSVLCRKNIKADFYIAVERTEDVYDSLAIIKDHREFFMETLCIGLDVVHPRTFSLFKHKAMIIKGNELMPAWLVSNGFISFRDFAMAVRVNPLVSNFGLEFVSMLGFQHIYMLGIDNGAVGEQSHCRFSMYYDENNNLLEQYKGMILDDMPMFMPGNFAEKVRTNRLFKLAARMMELTMSNYKEQSEYFNCSNGMRVERAKSLHFADVDWDSCGRIDKSMLRNILLSSVTRKLELDPRRLRDSLKADKFNRIMDEIYHDWDNRPATRVEFVLREEYQAEYLKGHGDAGVAPSKAIGSTYEMFMVLLNQLLYFYNDEQKSIDLAYEMVRRYLRRLFTGARLIYSKVLDFQLGRHRKYVEAAIRAADEVEFSDMPEIGSPEPELPPASRSGDDSDPASEGEAAQA